MALVVVISQSFSTFFGADFEFDAFSALVTLLVGYCCVVFLFFEQHFFLICEFFEIDLELIVFLCDQVEIPLFFFYCFEDGLPVVFVDHYFSPFFDLVYLFLLAAGHLLHFLYFLQDFFLLFLQLLHS